MKILLPEYIEILQLFNKNNVEFMLIGGYAVIHYGYERTTGDLDIWVKNDNDNKGKLLLAFKEFGIIDEDLSKLKKMDFTEPQVLFFGEKPRRIDILTKVSGVNFEEAIEKANYFPLKQIKIPIIHFEHLILTKIANKRPQDIADVAELQRIIKLKNKKR